MRRQWTLVLVMIAALAAACGSSPSFRGSELADPVAVPDFLLVDQHGQPFRVSDHDGQVLFFFFGYTQCPDVCPTTLASWRKVHEALGDDAQKVSFAFVTVDPERDSAEHLGLHVNAFNPDFYGLTGAPQDLEAIYRFFDVFFEKDTSSGSAAGYLISHTATTFVVDPEGQWRLRISYGTPVEDIVYDIQLLLP